ncbi:hypothetical protein J1614_006685 [Plenodomus biglobosus]|nr:hypothetical protein J1614_006685 [Plenodomus biglobosus]
MSESAIKREEVADDYNMELEMIPPGAPSTISRSGSSSTSNDDLVGRKHATGTTAVTNSAPDIYCGSSPWKHKFSRSEVLGPRSFAAPLSMTLPKMPVQGIRMPIQGTRMPVQGNRPNDGHGLRLPFLPQMINMQENDNSRLHLQQTDTEELANKVDSLRGATANNAQQVAEHDGLIAEVLVFNQSMQTVLQQLSNRVAAVEYENSRLSYMLENRAAQPYNEPQPAPIGQLESWCRGVDNGNRSRSPSPELRGYRDRGNEIIGRPAQCSTASDARHTKARKQLQIAIPEVPDPSAAGLPTPLSRNATMLSAGLLDNIPKTPMTPGRIGPNHLSKKSSTSINKRKNHSLDKIMPPAFVEIPAMPLTDTEVIVYFFQSLSRPAVALRLYSREWGPRNIVDALHAHRSIDPPYLRNTCSVKCTTAIKLGRAKFGDEWEDNLKAKFREATDGLATDLMRHDGKESSQPLNYYVRNLCVGLIKHPEVGVDGGLFTRCVIYCHQTHAPYTLFNVWQLAEDLQWGRTPTHPPPDPELEMFIGSHYHPHLLQDEDDNDQEAVPKTPKTPKLLKTSQTPKTPKTPKVSRPSTPDLVFSVQCDNNALDMDTA